MTISPSEYADLSQEMGPRLDDLISDAREVMERLLRPLNRKEKLARGQLIQRRPDFYEKAGTMPQQIYEAILDVTLVSDGFPSWSQLSEQQRCDVAFLAAYEPRMLAKVVMRAGLARTHEIRRKFAAGIQSDK